MYLHNIKYHVWAVGSILIGVPTSALHVRGSAHAAAPWEKFIAWVNMENLWRLDWNLPTVTFAGLKVGKLESLLW